eukprot:CAMPEP_0197440584 /NCGR_PEP_ID=MMETSP1175-20131217/7048_1 /TAXON_ID=1003142 /ORGANISM="Triceratium dubium, Strain CCMP147" /LENGTH=386 /DNA_ID=CAMNT_0042970719 /DNA_START=91 /DNA_END=1251 /DNA_ORIENTATION=-
MNTAYKLSSPAGEIKSVGCGPPNLFWKDEAPPSWEELEDVEIKRREILKRVELPFWRILFSWTGTCLRALALDWMIWIPIAVYCIMRVRARAGGDNVPQIVQALGDTNIDILGGFLSFLLVLFVNQTNTRFFEMYSLSKKAAGLIQDVAGLATTQLPQQDTQRIVRYMNAAHVIGYVGLGGPYSTPFFDHFNREYKLLSTSEKNRVDKFKMTSGSAAFKEVVTWCQRDVGRARKAGYIDSIEAEELQSRILGFRAAMDGIYDYCDQPVHFFYVHFLCLLSVMYLPLFAVDSAFAAGWGEESDWSIELISGLIVLLQSIFVVGLRLLGQFMIDPFGDDLEDLSVITYVSSTIENTRIITTQQTNVDDTFDKQFTKQNDPNSLAAEMA